MNETLFEQRDGVFRVPGPASMAHLDYTEIAALMAALALKLDASAYTAADVLTKVKTVDGTGSGLDADLLDGLDSSSFLSAASYTAADVLSKLLTVDGAGSGLDADLLDGISSAGFVAVGTYTAADVLTKVLTVDGAGSLLDADLLDGVQGSDYARISVANDFTSGLLTVSGGSPFLVLSETDQASTDERLWAHLVNAKIYSLGSYTAGFAASRAQLTFTRGTGAAVTNIAIGNTSDNAAVSFAGTGAVSIGGALSVTGAVTVPNTSFTYAKLQDVSATSRVLGRITAGSGVIEELTGANLATIIGTSLGANPSASIGLTAVNGSAATYLRSDAAPALSVTISPAWSGVHNWTTRQQVFGTTTANIALVSGLGDTGVSIHGVEAIRIHRVAADGFLALLRVNGSYGSPTTLVSGNSAGNISFGGYDGTTIQQSSALIFLDVTETWSGSARGGNLRFQTTTTGSTTKTDRFRIGADSTGGFAQVPDGVLAQVGLGFITDPDCGLYRIGTNNWAGAAGGNKIFDVSTTAFGITGNLSLTTAGNKHLVKEGTNASMGLATLAAGTVVVNTTVVSATSRIQLTVQALGTVAAPKAVAVTARTAGTSFTITSSDATDTSTVAWLIVEPA